MTSISEQLTSSLAGRYAIEREIGRGGMATVFLARDLRHDRFVALKVLNSDLGAVLGVDRFLEEIRVTANLQHPNLLPLFDSGEANGLLFYVMPYVQGESLRAHLDRHKQLAVDESVRIAVAVANALEYAHGHGVIHRDLKPENILLQSGQPVVSDFGIALAVRNAGGARLTQTGLSLGTPHYMSPEQATGDRDIDARSDIYSLAAVLYEMLTGEPPHSGPTVQAVIARVLSERPRSVRTLRPTVPEQVEASIERGLEKLPADRWPAAHAFADALQGRIAVAKPASALPSAPGKPRTRLRDPVVLALGAVALAGATFGIRGWRNGNPSNAGFSVRIPIRVDRPPAEGGWFSAIAISPDGRSVAYPQRYDRIGLWVRSLAEVSGRLVAPGGMMPFFSPDGSWLGFRTPSGRLFKMPVRGGTAVPLLDGPAPSLSGASWAPGGVIIVSIGNRLMMLPDNGGTARALIPLDSAAGETGQRNPHVLADGKTVLYESVRRDAAESRIGVASIDGGPGTTLDLPNATPIGVIDDRLIYGTSSGSIMAVSFDVRRKRTQGAPAVVIEAVDVGRTGTVRAGLSHTGSIVFAVGSANTQVVFADMKGNARVVVDEPRNYSSPRFSPDGKRLAFSIAARSRSDIWIRDLTSGTTSNLTPEEPQNARPEWHPDGKRVLYSSNRQGVGLAQLRMRNADFSGTPEVIEPVSRDQVDRGGRAPTTMLGVFAPTGDALLMVAASDLFYRNLRDGSTTRITDTRSNEFAPRFSPDGKWIAYASTGDPEIQVYVQPFPPTGARYKVTESGGMTPTWSPDGSRIYYVWAGGLHAATVRTSPEFSVVRRDSLFSGDYVLMSPPSANYDISPNGDRFVLLRPVDSSEQLVVVHDWRYELRERTRAGER